jgi:hypothetical protein
VTAKQERRRPSPKIAATLAVLDSLMFAVLVGMLLWRAVPDSNRELVAAAAGFIAGWVSAARNFHYGSSAGGETKTQALADQASALAQAAPAAAAAAAASAPAEGQTAVEAART